MMVRQLFQFHNGTINTRTDRFDLALEASFNSTTVQLIRCTKTTTNRFAEFQFHNGTINTGTMERATLHENMFQFHNGTINTQQESE